MKKLNIRDLKVLIKEVAGHRLNEGPSHDEALFNALDEYVMALDEEMGYDVPIDQLKAEAMNFVDGYFEQYERENSGSYEV